MYTAKKGTRQALSSKFMSAFDNESFCKFSLWSIQIDMGQKKGEIWGDEEVSNYMYMSCVAIFIVYNSMRVRARIAY